MWLFLDSGAGMSIVGKVKAESASLKVEGAIEAKGNGVGTASLGLARNVVLELAGARVPPATVAVWDLAPIQPMIGRQCLDRGA